MSAESAVSPYDDVWVVARCLNEAPVVGSVLAELHQAFPRVVAVDDGSTDDSYGVMAAAGVDMVRHAVDISGLAGEGNFE